MGSGIEGYQYSRRGTLHVESSQNLYSNSILPPLTEEILYRTTCKTDQSSIVQRTLELQLLAVTLQLCSNSLIPLCHIALNDPGLDQTTSDIWQLFSVLIHTVQRSRFSRARLPCMSLNHIIDVPCPKQEKVHLTSPHLCPCMKLSLC